MPLSCALKVFIGIYFEAQTPKLKLLSTQMVVIRPVLSIIVLSGDKKNTPKHGNRPGNVVGYSFARLKVKGKSEQLVNPLYLINFPPDGIRKSPCLRK